MATNKYALIRERIIDQMIGNEYKPYPTKEDLRQACEETLYGITSGDNVSPSSIEKDIRNMKNEYDAPIKFSKSYNGYYYSEKGFSIELTSEQIDGIKFGAKLLSQFKGIGLFKGFNSAIEKVLERTNVANNLGNNVVDDFVQFEHAPNAIGVQFLEPLLQGIKNKKQTKIEYTKFNQPQLKNYLIEPYLLKQYRNRWYVIGMDTQKKNIRTFGLDRIKKVLVMNSDFENKMIFNVQKFFKHNIGITTFEATPEEIIIALSPLEAMYLKSQPLHPSQKIISENETEIIISLRIIITKELLMKILSLGSEAKVISPNKLQVEIKKVLSNAISNYGLD